MNTYCIGKEEYTIKASCFNDLDDGSLVAVCKVLLLQQSKDLADLQMLFILLGLNRFSFYKIPIDAKARMIMYIQWVYEIRGLTKQLIPHYKGLFAPASEFDNLTMEEWNACEIYYHQYIKNNEVTALDKLIAVLYREPKKYYDFMKNVDGDCRVPFNEHECEWMAKRKIVSWSDEVKMAILAWYDGCREAVTNMYDLFNGEGDEESNPGMFEIMRLLSGERYGNFNDIKKLNVHIALRDMKCTKKENERLEAQLKASG